MGNQQSTSQKVNQIIQNYTEANAISNAKSVCTQNINIDASGALITNCGGFKLELGLLRALR